MNARIPPANRLAKSTINVIDEYANQQAQARADAKMARREAQYFRRMLKIVCVANNKEFGIGAKRAMRLINRISTMLADEDDDLIMRHVDEYLAKMGLEFWDAEDDA